VNKGFDLLVVEDEPVVLSAIKKIVESENLTMDEAADADTALKKLKTASYSLMITDLMLPKTSGFELLQAIRNDYPKLPVIVITGYATLESALQAFKLGSFDFVAKPFDMETFLGVVERGLKYSRELRENPSFLRDCIPEAAGKEEERWSGDIYCLGSHAWTRLFDDGAAEVGVGETFPHMIENLDRVEIVSVGEEINMGKCCARFWTKEGMVNMFWAPLSGKVIAVNHAVEENPGMLDSVPYIKNWLLRIIPTNLENELAQLDSCFRKKTSEESQVKTG
jgi:CheY-like chemotaxis protein